MNTDVWIFTRDGESRPIAAGAFNQYQPEWSPDGRFIAYVSDESGIEEVYVVPYPDLDRRWLISRDGGREPRWRGDSGELFYRRGREVMAVAIEADAELQAGTPVVLFEGDYLIGPGNPNPGDYDVSADGQRFLMIRVERPNEQINVILNWFDELERLVPIP